LYFFKASHGAELLVRGALQKGLYVRGAEAPGEYEAPLVLSLGEHELLLYHFQ